VLPSDLTALVFSNLLWFLLTLCLGSVLVTRPYRRERVARAVGEEFMGGIGHGACDVLAADEPALDEEFGVGNAFRVSDYLVLSDYPVEGEELAAGDELADDVSSVTNETIARDLAETVVIEPLAPLPAVMPPRASDIVAPGLATSGRSLPRRSGPARHRRPRPAVGEKVRARAAAVAIAAVMVGGGTGLGLHVAGGGHTPAVPTGAFAANIFSGTGPPAIRKPTTPQVAPHHARLASARSVPLRDRLQAARAQLAATLSMSRFLGHDMGMGSDGRLLLRTLTRKATWLRAEIVRMEQRLGAATRRTPASPIRLTSVTKHAPARGGQARHRPPVARMPVGEVGRRAEAVAYAQAQLGKPYVWGGAGPYGFDCSGLVMMAWQAAGVLLPHFTGDQWADTYHISRRQLEPGDLVFSNGFGHVQMYVGHGEVIQAPYTGEVVSYAPLPPPVEVDGYASVFPPGHLVPHARHVGGAGHHGTRGHRRGSQRRRRHSARGHGRAHAHHHRPSVHHRTRGHHRVGRHHRARGRHHRARARHHRGRRHHRSCAHHRARGLHRTRRHRR
jgi:hypothetical protein